MNITAQFPGKYLRACDLPHPLVVTMSHVVTEEIKIPNKREAEKKPILYFVSGEIEHDRGLVLNITNACWISTGHPPKTDFFKPDFVRCGYGEETDDWKGKKIVIFSTQCEAFGEMVDCIRARMPTEEEKVSCKAADLPF